MVPNILSSDLPMSLPPSVGLNSTFLEHGHVAYQIKGNHEFSNMVANNLHADPPPPPPPPGPSGMGSKFQNSTFSEQNIVMLHIKLKGIMNVTTS